MRRPSPDALAAAEALSRRNHDRTAQIRRHFIERPDVTSPTPLAKMLRGGRGGSVRLKTYLGMLWLAAAPPHDLVYPARAWATLLDLPDPEGLGARRVNDAVAWLEDNHFVTVEQRPGQPNRITLLRETGRDLRYSIPGRAYNSAKSRGRDAAYLERHRYIQVSPSFWTSGWFAVLSGPGIAMYLVLLAAAGGRSADEEIWFSPNVAKQRYSLSEDTRGAGIDELRRAGLVLVKRRPVSTDVFDTKRRRNVFQLVPERLSQPAEVAPDLVSLREAKDRALIEMLTGKSKTQT